MNKYYSLIYSISTTYSHGRPEHIKRPLPPPIYQIHHLSRLPTSSHVPQQQRLKTPLKFSHVILSVCPPEVERLEP
jgi:hypothetical protein